MRARLRSGSTTQTRRVPASSQSPTLARISPGRSCDDSTSSARSGGKSANARGSGSGTRLRWTNATSGQRTVIRTGRKLEPWIADQNLAEPLRPGVLHELKGDPRGHVSVEVSGRLLHNQPPAYQLDLLAR